MPVSGSGSGQQESQPPSIGSQGQRQAPEECRAVGVGKHCDRGRTRAKGEKPQQSLDHGRDRKELEEHRTSQE